MTVLPPGLIALPDVPPIVEQIPPRLPPSRPRRSPVRRIALAALIVVTVAAGVSAVREHTTPSGSGDPAPAAADVDLAPAAPGVAPAG